MSTEDAERKPVRVTMFKLAKLLMDHKLLGARIVEWEPFDDSPDFHALFLYRKGDRLSGKHHYDSGGLPLADRVWLRAVLEKLGYVVGDRQLRDTLMLLRQQVSFKSGRCLRANTARSTMEEAVRWAEENSDDEDPASLLLGELAREG